MLLLVDLRVLEVESPLVVCVVADGRKLDKDETCKSFDVGEKRRRESIS